MTETSAGEPLLESPPPSSADLWGPPGIAFWIATALLVAFTVWLGSDASFLSLLLAGPMWLLFASACALRFVATLVARRLRLGGQRALLDWLAVPGVTVLTAALVLSGVPWNVRFALSRPFMEQAAQEIMAGGSTDRGWIGLWPASYVERTANGMQFVVSGAGFVDELGFAYAADGRVESVSEPDSGNRYQQLDDHWFEVVFPF